MFRKTLPVFILCFTTLGCANLHSIQLGDIYADKGDLIPFEFKVNETGLNIGEASAIGKAFVRNKQTRQAMSTAQTIIAMFQYGPRTGNLVYSEDYANMLFQEIRKECPSGQITGLVSIRETRKYPVISGEIVKIKGYCIKNGKRGA